jgi:hypothetical protein
MTACRPHNIRRIRVCVADDLFMFRVRSDGPNVRVERCVFVPGFTNGGRVAAIVKTIKNRTSYDGYDPPLASRIIFFNHDRDVFAFLCPNP